MWTDAEGSALKQEPEKLATATVLAMGPLASSAVAAIIVIDILANFVLCFL
jgi:hypothetical protein